PSGSKGVRPYSGEVDPASLATARRCSGSEHALFRGRTRIARAPLRTSPDAAERADLPTSAAAAIPPASAAPAAAPESRAGAPIVRTRGTGAAGGASALRGAAARSLREGDAASRGDHGIARDAASPL